MRTNNFVFLLLAFGIAANVYAAPPLMPLTVTVQGGGFVTSDPAGMICQTECTESYKKNTSVTLMATSYLNGSFLGWQGDCVGTQPTCNVKLLSPTSTTALFDSGVATYPSAYLSTNQDSCYDSSGGIINCMGTGQDGEVKTGIPWPSPRFMDNGDGTVTDLLTDLVWLQNVNCFGETLTWSAALSAANNLASGQCGLNDGSAAGYWRLPSIREQQTLHDPRCNGIDEIGCYAEFTNTNVATIRWWTSTTYGNNPVNAFMLDKRFAGGGAVAKANLFAAWPVKRN